MSETDAVTRADAPRTRDSLATDLRNLGLEAGMTVLVHSALSALGWVCGGPVAVVQALQDVLTPEGTLVMPAFSNDLSDPALWQHPPVPDSWWPAIYETMPAYDPRTTPTRGMGRIAEGFRSFPGVLRSGHPQFSFAAWGRDAAAITAGHELDFGLGEGSPLARIYVRDGWVLLLGVGYGNNTSFHLSEYRAPGAAEIRQGSPVMAGGQRVWRTFRDIDTDDSSFPEVGAELEREQGGVAVGQVGSAECRLFRQRPAVDFATDWLRRHRG